MVCREAIIIAISCRFVVVLTAGFVPSAGAVLTAGFVPAVCTPVTFVGVAVLLTAGFVPAGVLFVVGLVEAGWTFPAAISFRPSIMAWSVIVKE